jgi:hypothetical protein
MKRRHLIEFEDLDWFPALLRDDITDFLQFIVNRFGLYQGMVPLLKQGILSSGTNQVVDLASGGGGGWLHISPTLQKEVPGLRILLSDRYPNLHAFETLEAATDGLVSGITTPIDARQVPETYRGLRTQFLSFHHFNPDDARQILQDAVDKGVPIVVVEIQRRDWPNLLKNLLSPVTVLLTTPFIRPFRWRKLLFTYAIPVVPLVVGWDGVVSVLRTYNEGELREIIDTLNGAEDFTWEIGVERSGMAPVYYLAGFPGASL